MRLSFALITRVKRMNFLLFLDHPYTSSFSAAGLPNSADQLLGTRQFGLSPSINCNQALQRLANKNASGTLSPSEQNTRKTMTFTLRALASRNNCLANPPPGMYGFTSLSPSSWLSRCSKESHPNIEKSPWSDVMDFAETRYRN